MRFREEGLVTTSVSSKGGVAFVGLGSELGQGELSQSKLELGSRVLLRVYLVRARVLEHVLDGSPKLALHQGPSCN